MKVAFYKGRRRPFNWFVSWWDNGPYSHCEILGEHFGGNEYMCYSSSAMDKGVRKKRINLDPKKWDIVEVDADMTFAMEWFNKHEGAKYDYLGLVGYLIRIIPGKKNRFVCSEALCEMLGYKDAWRFTPNSLAASVKRY
jgi:hypothetical protein